MKHAWEIPASAWLDPRWNACLDLASKVPVSHAKLAEAWDRNGPDRVLARLRELTAGKEPARGDAA